VEARSGFNYVPHTGLPQLTSATLRSTIGGKSVFASDDEQRAEVLKQATAFLSTLDDLVVDGTPYKVLYFQSDADHLYDPSRPTLVDRQLTKFHNDQPPTTATTLNRPLGAVLELPEALWRPFDCHADSFSEYSHNCVVQMLHKSIITRTQTGRGDMGGVRVNAQLPMLSLDSIHAEMDICFTECGYTEGLYPFSDAGWREEGIPSRMVVHFCERQTASGDPTACTIFHNGLKLYENVPNKPVHQVVFSAQGAHCFFYKGQAVRAVDLHSPTTSAYACTKVRESFEAEYGSPFNEWRPYSVLKDLASGGFADLKRPKRCSIRDEVKVRRESLYFYTKDDDLEAIYLELKAIQCGLIGSDYSFGIERSYAGDAEQIAGLSITARGLPKLVIRAVPLCADDLVVIAKQVGFVYKGSSLAKFGDDLRVHCFKRTDLSEADKQAILKNQEYKCAVCNAEDVLEFDHIVPLSAGATSDFDNMQALCTACHRTKTEAERRTYGSAWSSRLSRDVVEGLVNAPPPRQLVWGDGGEGYELDVVQCRTFALQKAERLHIADVLDAFEAWADWMPWDTVDFIFIDAGPCSDQPMWFCAYAGPRWYSRTMVQWILESGVQGASGVITTRDFGAVFRASRSITGDELERVFDRMRVAIEAGLQETGNFERPYADKLPKLCLLSMLGRWNTKGDE